MISRVDSRVAVRSNCDAIFARHEYLKQPYQAGAIGAAHVLDGQQADEDLFIASLTIAEIRRGIFEKAAGKKRDQLEAWFSRPAGPQSLFAGRMLPFEEKAALVWGRLMADGKARGRPRRGLGTIIAAVAEANECVVVTDNEKDFAELQIVGGSLPLDGSRRLAGDVVSHTVDAAHLVDNPVGNAR